MGGPADHFWHVELDRGVQYKIQVVEVADTMGRVL